MDDYSALAYRIAGGVADVRGCLILSRDGLILGSYPDDETAVKPAWMKFASLGDPERSFVEFGDQVWVYVRRPSYGAFAVADAGVRPGLVIDQLEQILFAAEEARSRRDTLRVPEPSPAPSGKPRTSLHPSGERVETVVPGPVPAGADTRPWARGTLDLSKLKRPETEDAAAAADPAPGPDPEPAEDAATVEAGVAAAPQAGAEQGDREPGEGEGTKGSDGGSVELDADAEVDPVLLAKEFSGLLQVESGVDEASS